MGRQVRHPTRGCLVLFASLLLALPLLLGFNFPKATGYVTDAANLIAPAQRTTLDTELRSVEKETGWEVAVVTVPTLDGQTVERYAQDLFVSYGIGKKGTDNGVLLLVARQERKVRIHTGYHAESVVTDAIAKQIISDVISPKTKAEDWSGGIVDGAHAITKLIRSPAQAQTETPAKPQTSSGWVPLLFLMFVGGFVIVALRSWRRRSGGWFGGDDSGGSSSDSGGFGGGDSGGGGASGDC